MQWHKRIIENKFLNFIVVFAFIMILISFYSSSFYLFAFSSTFFLFGVLSKWYLKHAANGMLINQNRQKVKLFPNETGSIDIQIEQYGRIPILNSKLHFFLDNVVDCHPLSKGEQRQQVEAIIPLTMSAKEALHISLPIYAKRRGFAKIRSVYFTLQHPFGFGIAVMEYNQPLYHEIIIYPTPISVDGIEQILPKRQGNYSNRRSLFEQQNSPIGTRDYRSGDPFNRIHWLATAKTQTLQTKIYDKTSLFAWSIIVTIKDGNGLISNLENVMSYITYICHTATQKNIMFELFINIRSAGKVPFFHLPLGTGAEQLDKALEMLARVNQHSVLISLERMMLFIAKHHTLAPYVIFSGPPQEDVEMMKSLLLRNETIYQVVDQGETGYLQPLSRKSTSSVVNR
ncbi:DUF58 domain-containing protein [Fredinandcohnia sp. 179-A 10B2 NHS]|uniref:DUF58 domain-containing protein n=1 Tax=Fredinandcohnia sp. 179-A 10B2 NHS TaxID=3235176 RepID=UPI0039A2DF06